MTRKASKKPKVEKKEIFARIPMEQYKQIALFCKQGNQKVPDFIRSLITDFFKNHSPSGEGEPTIGLAHLLFQMELLLRQIPTDERLSYFKRLDALKSQLVK